ncbi:putative membrane protein [Wenyingzhuangia heitensis]|uniref:Membrane protein n=1 Tax=Wenyingzhuangia heitensis TaxID=1487859 RepID=A0ABX0U6D4_9FLAO|nr:DUF2061 domain-containing protein [Wenyingzhuangia heitensis]NIJ44399.1 putative membrane protein [Wenyingzhuangia heitensis]
MITEKILGNKSDASFKESTSSDKPIRSVVKAVSWRVVGTLDTLLVSWYATGNLSMASSIASIDFVTKMILYFFHERAWNAIKWGKNE